MTTVGELSALDRPVLVRRVQRLSAALEALATFVAEPCRNPAHACPRCGVCATTTNHDALVELLLAARSALQGDP